MNRLRMLLITSALIAGSSALASAEEYHTGLSLQVRIGDQDRDHARGYAYGYVDGARDRDDHYRVYVDRDQRDRDNSWRRDNDDRRGRNWDHDGDRR